MSSSEDSNEAETHWALIESISPSKTQKSTFVDPLKGLITSSSGDERVVSNIWKEEEKKLPDLHELLDDSESIFNLAPQQK